MIVALLGACREHDRQLPDRENFTQAVNQYLAQRGRLCLALYDWPVMVTAADQQANDLRAQQMPVLEAHGLVARRDVATNAGGASAREYRLTAEGQKYYLHVPVVIRTASQHLTHPADLCVAALSLDRVIGWEKPMLLDDQTVTSVLFTYRIRPVSWAVAPDVHRAFPAVARAMANAGVAPLRLGVHLTPKGWIADELSQ